MIEIPELELEYFCTYCHGSGKSRQADVLGDNPCRKCNGAGYIISNDGEKVLTFLQRHWDRWVRDHA